ncbi:MAG TPA: mevalonate kinase [Candidatus Methanomethylophilaceae archaeon]|nr:mevalonate kinase [Candidatus Methanomethylophilaceae archaeon]
MDNIVASAPGKVILFGEHAVVYGKPALALAIDRRFRCQVSHSEEIYLDGKIFEPNKHPYTYFILSRYWPQRGLDIELDSDIPSGSGLGSSAALCVSLNAALMALRGEEGEGLCAKRSFDAELGVQGSASPLDTSVSTHGHGISINLPNGRHLWDIQHEDRRWSVGHIDVPEMTLVVGYTGVHAPTGPLVAKVRRYYDHSAFAREIIDEIESVTIEGEAAIRAQDMVRLGSLMTQNHKLLSILGVSGRELDRLVDASLMYSYGAKLTGAGGGGSMIALTDRPDDVCEAIKLHGGTPFVVHTEQPGVTVQKKKRL